MTASDEADKNGGGARAQKRRELLAFLFLAGLLAPMVAAAAIGGIGLWIWIVEIFQSAP